MGIRDRLKGKLKSAMAREHTSAQPRKQRAAAPVASQARQDDAGQSGMTRPRTVDETATTRRLAALVGDDRGLAAPEVEAPSEDPAVEGAPVEDAPAPEPEHSDEPEGASIAEWSVRLQGGEEGDLDLVIRCEEGETVLDAADRQGVVLPSSCRAGGCYVCAGRLVSGELHQEEQYVLEDEHLEQGFRLLCSSWPISDVVVLTHQNEHVT